MARNVTSGSRIPGTMNVPRNRGSPGSAFIIPVQKPQGTVNFYPLVSRHGEIVPAAATQPLNVISPASPISPIRNLEENSPIRNFLASSPTRISTSPEGMTITPEVRPSPFFSSPPNSSSPRNDSPRRVVKINPNPSPSSWSSPAENLVSKTAPPPVASLSPEDLQATELDLDQIIESSPNPHEDITILNRIEENTEPLPFQLFDSQQNEYHLIPVPALPQVDELMEVVEEPIQSSPQVEEVTIIKKGDQAISDIASEILRELAANEKGEFTITQVTVQKSTFHRGPK